MTTQTWKPLTEGIYFKTGQRTVCELVEDDTPPLGATDLLDDIAYLAATVSIIHHRKNVDYADREALLKAERVQRWIKSLKEKQP